MTVEKPYYSSNKDNRDDPENIGLILIDIQKTIEKVKLFNSAGFQVSISRSRPEIRYTTLKGSIKTFETG